MLHSRLINRGYSLFELTFIVVVLGILSYLVIPKVTDMGSNATQASEEYVITSLNHALEVYNARETIQ